MGIPCSIVKGVTLASCGIALFESTVTTIVVGTLNSSPSLTATATCSSLNVACFNSIAPKNILRGSKRCGRTDLSKIIHRRNCQFQSNRIARKLTISQCDQNSQCAEPISSGRNDTTADTVRTSNENQTLISQNIINILATARSFKGSKKLPGGIA